MKAFVRIHIVDLMRFYLVYLLIARPLRILCIVAATVFLPLMVWLEGPPYGLETIFRATLLVACYLVAGIVLGSIGFLFQMILLETPEFGSPLGKQEFEVTSEGFYYTFKEQRRYFPWSKVREVKVLADTLGFKASNHAWHLISARSFPDKESFDQFEALARQHWIEAKVRG